MTRWLLLLAVTLLAATPLAAQGGYWLAYDRGPAFGFSFPLGSHFSLDPGIYISFGSSETKTDSSTQKYNYVYPGLSAALRWSGDRRAAIFPVIALQLAAGRGSQDQEYDFVGSNFAAHSTSNVSGTELVGGVHAGMEVRLGTRAALSFTYDIEARSFSGTREVTTTNGFGVPTNTSTESYSETNITNGFGWQVRIYRKPD